ncbi:MAG: membrane protein [Chitinophagales bacterium]|nr:MAG: membrane protein [Chitinophagales bacterium]
MEEKYQAFLRAIESNGYEVLIAATLANVAAQWLKTLIFAITGKKFNLSMLFSTGGMPSSHSATVTGMAASVGLIEGFDSVLFAIAVCFAAIVMYDAAGVRRAASRQAVVLNRIIQNLFQNNPELNKGKLKELLGHTPVEVLAGAMLGILVSVLLRWYLSALG